MMADIQKEFADELLEAGLKRADFAEFYARGRLRRSLAVALLRIRKAAKLTQSELGSIVGWKQPYVARLEGDNSAALVAIERLEQYSSACGVSAMMLFIDKQTGEVKSSLAIGDSPLVQSLAKKMEGALPYGNVPLHRETPSRWTIARVSELHPNYNFHVNVLGNTLNVELPDDFLTSGMSVSNINLEFEEAHPIKKGEEKASPKYSENLYGAFLRSK